MRSILNGCQLTILLWVFLGLATGLHGHSEVLQARANINLNSHVRERFYLYEIYDIICEIEGPDKQQMILPFDKRKGDKSYYNNKGLTNANGKLTYAEFQWRLLGKPLIPGDVPNLVQPGTNGKTIQQAADELLKLGGGAILPAKEIDPSQKQKNYGEGGKNHDPNDPFKTEYHDLIEKTEAKISKYRLSGKYDSVLRDRLPRVTTLSNEIVTLRREDSMNYLTANMAKSVNDGGLGFDPVDFTNRPSAVAGGPNWDDPNIGQTYDNNQATEAGRDRLQGWGLGTRQALVDWVDNLGDPSYRGTGRWPSIYTDSENNHYRAAKGWRHVDERLNMDLTRLRDVCS